MGVEWRNWPQSRTINDMDDVSDEWFAEEDDTCPEPTDDLYVFHIKLYFFSRENVEKYKSVLPASAIGRSTHPTYITAYQVSTDRVGPISVSNPEMMYGRVIRYADAMRYFQSIVYAAQNTLDHSIKKYNQMLEDMNEYKFYHEDLNNDADGRDGICLNLMCCHDFQSNQMKTEFIDGGSDAHEEDSKAARIIATSEKAVSTVPYLNATLVLNKPPIVPPIAVLVDKDKEDGTRHTVRQL